MLLFLASHGRQAASWAIPALAALMTTASTARAQEDCDPPMALGPLLVTPANSARDVPRNAIVMVDYTPDYFLLSPEPPENLVQLALCPTSNPCTVDQWDAEPVSGSFQVWGDRVIFTPDAELVPGRRYALLAEGLDRSIDAHFFVQSNLDLLPPRVGPLLRNEPADSGMVCDVLPEGGRRVGLVFALATDDGARGSIEHLLYQTRGPGIDAPRLRDRYRPGSDPFVARQLLTREEASQPVCFRMVATDGLGRISEPGPETCVDPLTMPFFEPLCSVGHGRGGHVFALGLLAIALGLLGARRRNAIDRG